MAKMLKFYTSKRWGQISTNRVIPQRGHDWIKMSPELGTICGNVRKRNVRDVDKIKHGTRAYPDVMSTLFPSRSYVNATSAETWVTCFCLSTLRMLRLRKTGYTVLTYGAQASPRCDMTLYPWAYLSCYLQIGCWSRRHWSPVRHLQLSS